MNLSGKFVSEDDVHTCVNILFHLIFCLLSDSLTYSNFPGLDLFFCSRLHHCNLSHSTVFFYRRTDSPIFFGILFWYIWSYDHFSPFFNDKLESCHRSSIFNAIQTSSLQILSSLQQFCTIWRNFISVVCTTLKCP